MRHSIQNIIDQAVHHCGLEASVWKSRITTAFLGNKAKRVKGILNLDDRNVAAQLLVETVAKYPEKLKL